MTRFAAWGAGLSLAGMACSVWATTLPDATTIVNVSALSRGDQFQQVLGPQTQSQSLNLNWGNSVPDYPWDIAAWRSTGNVSAQLGRAGGQFGAVQAQADAYALGFRGESHSATGGTTQIAFRIVDNTPLGTAPLLQYVPLVFRASGGASWTGSGPSASSVSGGYSVSASIWGDDYNMLAPYPSTLTRLSLQDSTQPTAGNFDAVVSLGLKPGGPGDDRRVFGISTGAGCNVVAFGSYGGSPGAGTPLSASAQCSAWVDPSLDFDQAAFDADPIKYGASQSFKLANYYALQFSGNVPAVPEPATRIALMSGLLLLGKMGWRRTSRA